MHLQTLGYRSIMCANQSAHLQLAARFLVQTCTTSTMGERFRHGLHRRGLSWWLRVKRCCRHSARQRTVVHSLGETGAKRCGLGAESLGGDPGEQRGDSWSTKVSYTHKADIRYLRIAQGNTLATDTADRA